MHFAESKPLNKHRKRKWNQNHLRDESTLLIESGFDENEILLHFEQMKVEKLQKELDKVLSDIDCVKNEIVHLTKYKKEKEEMEQKQMLKVKESKDELIEKCAMEINRLNKIINKLCELPHIGNVVQCVIEKSYNIHWTEWTYLDVIKWIVALNDAKYAKYEQNLIKNMKNEQIDGHKLAKLSENDLKRLGIDNSSDCEEISKAIRSLIH